jgi:hypothetical protein
MSDCSMCMNNVRILGISFTCSKHQFKEECKDFDIWTPEKVDKANEDCLKKYNIKV